VPESIGNLVLEGVPLAGARLRIEVEGNRIVRLDKPETLKIESRPRRPTFVPDPVNSSPSARRESA
jgi:hypothetical protein